MIGHVLAMLMPMEQGLGERGPLRVMPRLLRVPIVLMMLGSMRPQPEHLRDRCHGKKEKGDGDLLAERHGLIVAHRRRQVKQSSALFRADQNLAAKEFPLPSVSVRARPCPSFGTVQIGVTLVGILAGAFGGATLTEKLAAQIARLPAWRRTARRSAWES